MTTDTKANPDPRAEYIAGLRQLADLLEQNPDLRLPYTGSASPFAVIPPRTSARDELAAWARALPGRKEKKPRGEYFDLDGTVRGLKIVVICNREEVCERIVVGSETVTETVPDPEYVASAPLVERTTEREIVEWVCTPSILADAEPVGVSA